MFIYIIYESPRCIWFIFQVARVKTETDILRGFNFLEIDNRKKFQLKKNILKTKENFKIFLESVKMQKGKTTLFILIIQ